jgi:hypothetical protein
MKTFLILSLLFLSALSAFPDQIYTKNKEANRLYKNGHYKEALKLYEDMAVEAPAEPKLKMNKGSALFQMGDLDKAEESYNNAAAGLKNKKALADLYYDLGNVHYMQGEQLGAKQDQGAAEKYKAAYEDYIKSLDLRDKDKDAKWNLQLASAKMKQMQNQQKNQSKNDKQNKQNQKDQQKQDKNNKDKNNKDKNKDQKKDQDKDQQNKDNKQQQDKNKQDQQKQEPQNDKNKQEQQKPEPTPQQQKQEDMKKDEAKKLIELYSDDEHDLNKKPPKTGAIGEKKSEKDW